MARNNKTHAAQDRLFALAQCALVAFRRKLWHLCALVVLLLACTILFWICVQALFAVPQADDFCYGDRAIRLGILNSVFREYMTWGGRYTSTLLMSSIFSYSKVITEYYYIGPIIILIANFFASRYILSSIGIRNHLFLIVFFTILVSSYSLTESVYWMSGGVTYGLGSALFISIIAAEISLVRHASSPTLSRVTIIAFASIILAGFNETIMVAHVSLLACLFILCAIFDKKLFKPMGIILSAAISGAVIVASAPGNSVRASHFREPDLFSALVRSLYWVTTNYLYLFLLTTILLCCALILLVKNKKEEVTPILVPWVLIWISLFFTLWASAFTRFYAQGRQSAERTFTVDCAIITILSLLIALYLYQKIWRHNSHRSLSPPRLVLLTGLFALALILRPVTDRFIPTELSKNITKAVELNRYMNNRFRIINSSNAEYIVLPELKSMKRELKSKKRGATITFFSDIVADPKDWRNQCFADYFNLKRVSLSAK
jgi:hypothetical protein